MMIRLVYSLLVIVLLYSCNNNNKDLEYVTKVNSRIIDSMSRKPVLDFFNNYLESKAYQIDVDYETVVIELEEFEKKLEKVKKDSVLYFSHKAYCSYLKGESLVGIELSERIIKWHKFNYLAECLLLFNNISSFNYNNKEAETKYKEISSRYPNENLSAFTKCYTILIDFKDNPSKYLKVLNRK